LLALLRDPRFDDVIDVQAIGRRLREADGIQDMMVVTFYTERRDLIRSIRTLLEDHQYHAAIKLLKEEERHHHHSLNQYTSLAFEMLRNIPKETIDFWIEEDEAMKGNGENDDSLIATAIDRLPALVQIGMVDNNHSVHPQVLRYLEHVIEKCDRQQQQSSSSSSLHDYLWHLYVRLSNDDRLEHYLERPLVGFHPYFGLQQCLDTGHDYAASMIHLKLGNNLDARKIAFLSSDVDRTLRLLKTCVVDEVIKQKLCFGMIKHLIHIKDVPR
jgi:hypothetical protein